MNLELELLQKTRNYSTIAVAVGLGLALIFGAFFDDLGWQVVLALTALAIGIPHGAMDHIVTVPKFRVVRMTLFITAYLGVVALAVWAILTFNVIGFIAVVVMSAVHFGIGDAAFIAEIDRRRGVRSALATRLSYALPAGFVPVLIPLVGSQTDVALEAVNPILIGWDGGLAQVFFAACLVAAALAALWLAITRRWRDLLDLALLTALALFTPPLVAFAIYFGTWHAMRHTARLTLELERSQQAYAAGNLFGAWWRSVVPGLPAMFGTFLVAAGIGLVTGGVLETQLLWFVLVLVWALTVPHMLLTTRLDRRALIGSAAKAAGRPARL
jgi:Brp/Blh family beta-carotene 15,15'-monooxygenase